jgi:hypothetical protein
VVDTLHRELLALAQRVLEDAGVPLWRRRPDPSATPQGGPT